MKKIIVSITTILLCMMMVLPVMAHPSRLVDDADLLTAEEENQIRTLLDEKSEDNAFDIVVVTVNSLEGESAEAYADDYFDYNGYGMGETYDGALFLISMDEREWHISTCGYGIAAISDNDLYEMEDEIVPYLSAGEYAQAFVNFAWLCDTYVKEAVEAGITMDDVESDGIGVIAGILGSIIVGFVLAFIPMLIMKSKMKSVAAKMEASDYMNRGSRTITRSQDRFLYHTINRVYTPKQETSSTHTSSSGRSHGGHGGGF